MKTRLALTATCVLVVVLLLVAAPANAGPIVVGTMPYWTGTGWGQQQTFGQTFTALDGHTFLDRFTFYAQGSPGPVDFSVYVMEWNGFRATGSVLFESDPFSVGNLGPVVGGFFPVVTSPHLSLQVGRSYVAFMSGVNQSGRPSDYLMVPMLGVDGYEGGYATAAAAFENVTTENWGRLDVSPERDIGFEARFCSEFPGGGHTGGCFPGPGPFPGVPEPASLLLLGTGLVGLRAWRKRRGQG